MPLFVRFLFVSTSVAVVRPASGDYVRGCGYVVDIATLEPFQTIYEEATDAGTQIQAIACMRVSN